MRNNAPRQNTRSPARLQALLPGGCHSPEPEPSPPRIDNRARGAIPSKPAVLATAPPTANYPAAGDPAAPPVDPAQQNHDTGSNCNSNNNPKSTNSATHVVNHSSGTSSDMRPPGTTMDGSTRSSTGLKSRHEAGGAPASGESGDDGRAWGGGDEEGEVVGLTTLPDTVDTEIAAGVGDAARCGRRSEERTFLEVENVWDIL